MTAILDAILNISKRSMMPEWHQLNSSRTMPTQQESTKKKTLKSSARSFWFSTGLYQSIVKKIAKEWSTWHTDKLCNNLSVCQIDRPLAIFCEESSSVTHKLYYDITGSMDMRRSRGGQGVRTPDPPPPPPPKNHKNIGVLSNTGLDLLKITKLVTKPAFNVGPSSRRQRNAI